MNGDANDGNPVFLVGAPRSGTTLLYKILCLHPDAAWISNWLARFPHLVGLSQLNRIAARFPEQRRAAWFRPDSNAYVFGSKRPLAARMFPMPVEGGPLFARFGLPKEPAESEAAERCERPAPEEFHADALQRAFDAICRYSGASVMISKRIINNRQIAQLGHAFPNARFVELVRDGRAVAYSLSRVDWWEDSVVWWYGSTPRRWREEGGDPWEIAARHWPEEVDVIHQGLAAVPARNVTRVRYESLVSAPGETLEALAAFVGLRPVDAWRAEVAGLTFRDRNDEWQAKLDAAVVQQIESVQRDHLREYGYVA
ncbi:MAG TPA: sulfotransferase [Acidimicrobiales bacterium]|nr:sulfotransferase [Acidimicrobiales bacterium]